MQVPPGVLGIIDVAYFRFVTDLGATGPDGGKGGRYLLVPPGYTGSLPSEGYFVQHPRTYINLFIVRAFVHGGDVAATVQNIKDSARVYALSAAADPPETTFVNISGVQFNTVQSNDFQFYEELNAVVRHEPADFVEPETAGLFAAIGIKKGQPFAPDARLKAILTDAVAVGNATARAIVFAPRDERTRFFPDRQWTTAFVGGSHEFMDRGERMLDVRALFHYYATGITPGDGSGAAGHRLGVWLHRPVTHKAATATAAKPTRSHCPVRYRSADSGFLHRVRHADPFNARNRPEAGGHRQHSTGAEGECRRIHDGVVRP